MTDKDRYIIYKMWVLVMRGIFCLLHPIPSSVPDLKTDFGSLVIALDGGRDWSKLDENEATP